MAGGGPGEKEYIYISMPGRRKAVSYTYTYVYPSYVYNIQTRSVCACPFTALQPVGRRFKSTVAYIINVPSPSAATATVILFVFTAFGVLFILFFLPPFFLVPVRVLRRLSRGIDVVCLLISIRRGRYRRPTSTRAHTVPGALALTPVTGHPNSCELRGVHLSHRLSLYNDKVRMRALISSFSRT